MTNLEAVTLQVKLYYAKKRSWGGLCPAAKKIVREQRKVAIQNAWLKVCCDRLGL